MVIARLYLRGSSLERGAGRRINHLIKGWATCFPSITISVVFIVKIEDLIFICDFRL